jgi:hypothetical protein
MTSPSQGYVSEGGGLLEQSAVSVFEETGAVSNAATDNRTYARQMWLRMVKAQERTARLAFDQSHPVDEYQWTQGIPQNPAAAPAPYTAAIQLTASWEVPERIESIIATVPVGATAAIVKLADRWINIHPNTGTALTAPATVSYLGLGIILNRDDDRLLLFEGTITAGPCGLELMGFADEVYGNA